MEENLNKILILFKQDNLCLKVMKAYLVKLKKVNLFMIKADNFYLKAMKAYLLKLKKNKVVNLVPNVT